MGYDIKTAEDVRAWQAAIDHELDGLEHVSSGACPGCGECGLSECDSDTSEGQHALDVASEGHFSWSACDACRGPLGGDRYPAHARMPEEDGGALIHLDVCADCYYFLANGYDDTMQALLDEEDVASEGAQEVERG